ncbi:hypothetical protein AAG570_010172 [Ranatra chinensis]|uniref:MaoC-like domain-containing protein n=1 Tax=Ranatra chinensis TaxID=642074 RepID=A0ABD0YLS5_9HEMI
MVELARDQNPRVKNLAEIFLADLCSEEQRNFKTLKNTSPLLPEAGATESLERTITKDDVEAFARLTGDTNTVHFESSDDGAPPIVHGALLNGIVSSVIGTKLPGEGTIVLSQNIRFPKPCFVGDTIVVNIEITKVRKIISCTYKVVTKRDDSVVMDGDAKLVVKKL